MPASPVPWEKQYNEAEVLDRATEAFWIRGYDRTSVTDLVAATGLNRGSLYNDFTDKRSLFIKVLRRYDETHRKSFLASLARDHAPKDAIMQAFRAVISDSRSGNNRKGCLLVNTSLELGTRDAEIETIVRSSLREVEKFFRAMAKAGQADGSIRNDLGAAALAKRLFALFVAMRVITRSCPERSMLKSILSQVNEMMQ